MITAAGSVAGLADSDEVDAPVGCSWVVDSVEFPGLVADRENVAEVKGVVALVIGLYRKVNFGATVWFGDCIGAGERREGPSGGDSVPEHDLGVEGGHGHCFSVGSGFS
jgi:hypothetical protein